MASNNLTDNLVCSFDFNNGDLTNNTNPKKPNPFLIASSSTPKKSITVSGPMTMDDVEAINYAIRNKEDIDRSDYPRAKASIVSAGDTDYALQMGIGGGNLNFSFSKNNTAYSISFWIAPIEAIKGGSQSLGVGFPSSSENPSFLAFQGSEKLYFQLVFNASSIDLIDQIKAGNGSSNSTTMLDSNPLATASTTFQHVVIVFTAQSKLQLYLNGILKGEQTVNAAGGGIGKMQIYQQFQLGKLKMYKAALTATEVGTLYKEDRNINPSSSMSSSIINAVDFKRAKETIMPVGSSFGLYCVYVDKGTKDKNIGGGKVNYPLALKKGVKTKLAEMPNFSVQSFEGFRNGLAVEEGGLRLGIGTGSTRKSISFWIAPIDPLIGGAPTFDERGGNFAVRGLYPYTAPYSASFISIQSSNSHKRIGFNENSIELLELFWDAQAKTTTNSKQILDHNPLAKASEKFQHIAITTSPSIKFYLNGQLIADIPLVNVDNRKSVQLYFYNKFKFANLKNSTGVFTQAQVTSLYLEGQKFHQDLLGYFDFGHSSGNIHFPSLSEESSLSVLASGIATVTKVDGLNGLSFGEVGDISSLEINFSKLVPATANLLTFSFWTILETDKKGKLKSGGQLIQVTDHFYLQFAEDGSNNLTVSLQASTTAASPVIISTLASFGNKWTSWGIILNGSTSKATLYYQIAGSKVSTAITLNTPDADLGLGTNGLGLQTMTIGKKWVGKLAQLQIWQIALTKQQLVNLWALAPTPFIPTLPGKLAKPPISVQLSNELQKAFVYAQANATNNALNIQLTSISDVSIRGQSGGTATADNFHFAFRLAVKNLAEGALVTLPTPPADWNTTVVSDANFISIYALYTGIQVATDTFPPFVLNGIIGAGDTLQLEVFYQNINTVSGFVLATPIPIYTLYIDDNLIANFDFALGDFGDSWRDAAQNGLTIDAPSMTTLANGPLFDYIFPLSGSNFLEVDASSAFIENTTQVSFSFWTKLTQANFADGASPQPFMAIADNYAILFSKDSSNLKISVQTPSATAITSSVTFTQVTDQWIFWTIALVGMTGRQSAKVFYCAANGTGNVNFTTLSGNPSVNLGLTARTIRIGEEWTAGFTNFCIWKMALNNFQVQRLLSNYEHHFPILNQNSTTDAIQWKLSTNNAVDATDLSKGMKITGSISTNPGFSITADNQIQSAALTLENCHFAFCFRKSDLAETCYTDAANKIGLGTNFICQIFQQEEWVFLLAVLNTGSSPISFEIDNIVPDPSVDEVRIQLYYRNIIQTSDTTNQSGNLYPPLPISVIKSIINKPLIATFNFDKTRDYLSFEDEYGNGVLTYSQKKAVVEVDGPFQHTVLLDGTDQLDIDFGTIQVKQPSAIYFTFWTKSAFSNPLKIQLGDGDYASLVGKSNIIVLNISGIQFLSSAIPAALNNKWVLWSVKISYEAAEKIYASIGYESEGQAFTLLFKKTLTRSLSSISHLKGLLGKTISIGESWIGNLAKFSVWQVPFTQLDSGAIFQEEIKDFPTLHPDAAAVAATATAIKGGASTAVLSDYAPISIAITNDPSIPISFANTPYLYNQELKGKNKLGFTITNAKSVTFGSQESLVNNLFNPSTIPFHFAICFRQEAIQDAGKNIELVASKLNGASSSTIQLSKQIDDGGTLWLYFLYTGSAKTFSTIYVELDHIVAAAKLVCYELVYQVVNMTPTAQTGFLPPSEIQTTAGAIETNLIADYDFSESEDFQSFPNTVNNSLVLQSAKTTEPDTSIDFDFTFPFNGSNNLSVDFDKILLATPTTFTIACWLKSSYANGNIYKIAAGANLYVQLSSDGTNITVKIKAGTGAAFTQKVAAANLADKWVYWSFTINSGTAVTANYWIMSDSLAATAVSFSNGSMKGSVSLADQELAVTAVSTANYPQLGGLQIWQSIISSGQMTDWLAAQLAGFTLQLAPEKRKSKLLPISFTCSNLNNALLSEGNKMTLTIVPNSPLSTIPIPKATEIFNPDTFNPTRDNWQFELRFRKDDLQDNGAAMTLAATGWNTPSGASTPQLVTNENTDGTLSVYFVYTNSSTAFSAPPLQLELDHIIANYAQKIIPFVLIYNNIGGHTGFALAAAQIISTIQDPLVVYFKFDQLLADSTTVYLDDEGTVATATLQGSASVNKANQAPLGNYVNMAAAADTVEIDLSQIKLNNPNQITFDFWAAYDPSLNTASGFILEMGDAFHLALPYGADLNIHWSDKQGSSVTSANMPDNTITSSTWIYYAIVLDYKTKKAFVYYKTYSDLQASKAIQVLSTNASPFTGASFSDLSGQTLTIGDQWIGAITRFRIWQTVLTQTQIQKISDLDQALFDPVLPGAEPSPIGFLLEDQKTQQPAIYITDPGESHTLELRISNTSQQDIIIPDGSSTPVNIFSLSFRSGTLADPNSIVSSASYIGQTDASSELTLIADGTGGYKRTQVDGTVTLQFQNSGAAITLKPDGSATGDSMITFVLTKVAAQTGSEGSRGTRVELGYEGITLSGSGNLTNKLNGVLLQYVNVINQTGFQNIPLHVGFVGSNTILNDGSTNKLVIQLQNIGNETIYFNGVKNPNDKDAPPTSQLIVSFDENEDWGLGSLSETGDITINVLKESFIRGFQTFETEFNKNFKSDLVNILNSCIEEAYTSLQSEYKGKNILNGNFADYSKLLINKYYEKIKSIATISYITQGINLGHGKTLQITDHYTATTSQSIVENYTIQVIKELVDTVVKSRLEELSNEPMVKDLKVSSALGVLKERIISSIPIPTKDTSFNNMMLTTKQPESTLWKITPPKETKKNHWIIQYDNSDGETNKASFPIGVNECVFLSISIKTTAKSGIAYCYLQYMDIHGYWNGRFTLPIEKSPLIFRNTEVIIASDANQHISIQTRNASQKQSDTRTDKNFNTIQFDGRIQDNKGLIMPVGSILPYAGTVAPAGWLLCDGSMYSHTEHPELFSILGDTYGNVGMDVLEVFMINIHRSGYTSTRDKYIKLVQYIKKEIVEAFKMFIINCSSTDFSTFLTNNLEEEFEKYLTNQIALINGDIKRYESYSSDGTEKKDFLYYIQRDMGNIKAVYNTYKTSSTSESNYTDLVITCFSGYLQVKLNEVFNETFNMFAPTRTSFLPLFYEKNNIISTLKPIITEIVNTPSALAIVQQSFFKIISFFDQNKGDLDKIFKNEVYNSSPINEIYQNPNDISNDSFLFKIITYLPKYSKNPSYNLNIVFIQNFIAKLIATDFSLNSNLSAINAFIYDELKNGDKFRIPDFRTRTAIGAFKGSSLFYKSLKQYPHGKYGGAQTNLLTKDEMPSHDHIGPYDGEVIDVTTDASDYNVPKLNRLVGSDGNATGQTFDTGNPSKTEPNLIYSAPMIPEGGNLPHNNMPPYLAINYIIKT